MSLSAVKSLLCSDSGVKRSSLLLSCMSVTLWEWSSISWKRTKRRHTYQPYTHDWRICQVPWHGTQIFSCRLATVIWWDLHQCLMYKQRHWVYLVWHHLNHKYVPTGNETLYSAVIETDSSHASVAHPAQVVYVHFKRALTPFSHCHQIYHSSQVSDEDIIILSM